MTDWMWFAAGVASLVAVLIFASLVSRLFREPATHRAGIDEDEDDPEEVAGADRYRRMIGEHLSPEERLERSRRLADGAPVLRIDRSLYPKHQTRPVATDADWAEAAKYYEDDDGLSLGPPPTYPETPEEHTR
jgi:hypothetical protein